LTKYLGVLLLEFTILESWLHPAGVPSSGAIAARRPLLHADLCSNWKCMAARTWPWTFRPYMHHGKSRPNCGP